MKSAHHYAIQVWWPLPIKIMGLVIQAYCMKYNFIQYGIRNHQYV